VNHSITIIDILKRGVGVLFTFVMLAVVGPVYAHGGFDHVSGIVVKIEQSVLTVKTAKGNVDVRLDDKTEITKGGHAATVGDLKPGTRVVVDIPEGSKVKIAHSVKVGVMESNSHTSPK
jgi:hypothetical protein